jgi:copper chaperone CopZ
MNKLYVSLTALLITITPLSAEILFMKAKISGMVCSACVTAITGALRDDKKVIQKVGKISLADGTVSATLKKRNKFTVKQLQNHLNATIKKATYQFEAIIHIKAQGIVSKNDDGHVLTIAGSKETIRLSSDFDEQAEQAASKKKTITLEGTLTKKDGSFILSAP